MPSVTEKIRDSIASIIDTGTHIDVAEATQAIGKKLGLSERMLQYTHFELRNKLLESQFKRVPFNERILLLPHCLKKPDGCKAKYGEEGLQCIKSSACKNCAINELTLEALKLGYKKVFVLPGGSMVPKLVKKYEPKAVVGVACHNELNIGHDLVKAAKIPAQGILLLKDGCNNTELNVFEVKEKLLLNSHGKEK